MKKTVIKRGLAIFSILLIVGCVGLTLIFAFTGNKNFMGMLLLTLFIPILLWIYMFFYKLVKDRSSET